MDRDEYGRGAVTGGLVFGFLAEGRAASLRASAVNWPLKPKTWPRLPMSFTGSVVLVSRPVLHWYFGDDAPSDLAFAPLLTSDGAFISIRGSLQRGLTQLSLLTLLSSLLSACVIDQISVNPMSTSAIAMTTVSVVSFAKRVLKRTIKKSRAFVFPSRMMGTTKQQISVMRRTQPTQPMQQIALMQRTHRIRQIPPIPVRRQTVPPKRGHRRDRCERLQ